MQHRAMAVRVVIQQCGIEVVGIVVVMLQMWSPTCVAFRKFGVGWRYKLLDASCKVLRADCFSCLILVIAYCVVGGTLPPRLTRTGRCPFQQRGTIMASGRETSTFVTKRLSQSDIRGLLRVPLSEANIDPLGYDALAEPDDIGVYAEQKMGFRSFGGVQISVNADPEENANVINVTAVWHTVAEILFATAFKQDIGTQISKGASLKLKSNVEEALREADPNLREVAF